MVFENINQVTPGMILGKNIIDTESNRILLKEGVVLTDNYISYLKKNGYKAIYVQDKNYDQVVVEDLIPEELKNSSIKALKDLNIGATIENAKRMVDEIIYRKDISFDYQSLLSNDYEHSIKVAEISIVIGKAMNYNQQELTDLATSALLHDFGKVAKDPANLKKLKYDEQIEYNEKLYPVYGFKLLMKNPDVKSTTKSGVLTHNIDEDGSNGLHVQGKTIAQHKFGKIIHVADIYDQIIENKYEDKLANPSEAMEFLLGGCGTKFNREVVNDFIKYVPVYPKGTRILLSNGLSAVVLENNGENPLRPKIVIQGGHIMDLMNLDYNNITIIDNEDTKEKNVSK